MSNAENKWQEQNKSWEKRFPVLAKETSIDEALIRADREQVILYFGEDWLREAYSKQKAYSPGEPTGIVGVITNPMDNHGVEVVELAKYLKAVEGQDNFSEIITKLRSTSDYEAIRLNLAVAYRLMHSDWENVYVEPAVGDVEGTLYGKKYVVECSVIMPPNPSSKYTNEIFRSVYKTLKQNKIPVWIHVKFNVDFKTIPLKNVIEAVKELNKRFLVENKPVETQTKELSMTACLLDGRVKQVLEEQRIKEDGITEVGFRIAMATPKIPGDVHSVDLDDPNQIEDGTITFGGLSEYAKDKTTSERLKTKIRDKKEQTSDLPSGTKRLFVFMANGKVEDDDWRELGQVVKKSTSPSDNIDAVLFIDRRRQEFEGKLRFPSGQVHIFTKPYRLTALEASFRKMKAFEESDWINEP
jgi:hypothetical protein